MLSWRQGDARKRKKREKPQVSRAIRGRPELQRTSALAVNTTLHNSLHDAEQGPQGPAKLLAGALGYKGVHIGGEGNIHRLAETVPW